MDEPVSNFAFKFSLGRYTKKAAKAAAAAAEAQAEIDRVDNRWAEGFWRRRFGRRRTLLDAGAGLQYSQADRFWRRRFEMRRLLSDAKAGASGVHSEAAAAVSTAARSKAEATKSEIAVERQVCSWRTRLGRRRPLSDSSSGGTGGGGGSGEPAPPKLGAVALLLRLDKPGQFPAAAVVRSFDGGRTWGALEQRPPGVGAPLPGASCAPLLRRVPKP
jgi:hypothetical protein